MPDKDRMIAERLKRERESIGYKLTDVARRMGFENHQVLGNIEGGKRSIKASELVRLARIYGRSAEFFLGEQSPAPRILWRDSAKTEGTKLAEHKFLDICQRYSKLLTLTQENIQPDFIRPLLSAANKQVMMSRSFYYVTELAEQARKMLDLGARPAHSLADVLEGSFGVLVVHWDLENAGSAASLCGEDCRAVVINTGDAPWRRNYDLAHELFHLITWDLFSEEEICEPPKQGKKNLIEQWADAFASALLLPEEEVRNEFQKRVVNREITYINLVEIAREFRVSIDALLWRLAALSLLKRKDVDGLLRDRRIREIDKQARSADSSWYESPYLSSRYVMLAIKAYFMGKLSRARFAEYIDKPFSQVTDFLAMNGYADDGDYTIAFAAHS
jgi:Zn-dependent peptidase ImmA (M78 family)/plasmid maintenance system antidote protein VapI